MDVPAPAPSPLSSSFGDEALAGVLGLEDAISPEPCVEELRSDLVDALLRSLADLLPASGVALVAAGGYGRGELFLGSDVDLLWVHSGEPGDPEPLWRRLWDLGVDLGSATRPVQALGHLLRHDLPSATALLEGRFLCGDRAVLEATRDVVNEFLASDGERFLDAKLVESEERYRRYGGAVCLLAPDLKQGRGQARDLQLARLFAACALHDPSDAQARAASDAILPSRADALAEWLELGPLASAEIERSAMVLRRARAALHELAPGQGDRLGPELQAELTQLLGYQDCEGRLALEVGMDAIYRAATLVDRVLRQARLLREPPLPPAINVPLAQGVAARGDFVVFDPQPPVDPSALLSVFVQAQLTQRTLSLRTLEHVRAARGLWRRDDRAVQDFRALLGRGKGVAQVVAAMHDTGLLGRFLPEFAALECLSQADPYHVYTVDHHSLAALRALEGDAPHPGVEPGREREDRLREELFQRTDRRDLLRLAVLLHDSGKVGGSYGHTERGLALAGSAAKRLNLSPAEARHVAFLVEQNPSFSRLCERLDVDAPETRDALIELCGRDPQRLDHLYLLTCADVHGVAPGALSRWKDSLITRLYERAARELEGTSPAPSPTTLEGWLQAFAGRVDPERLRAHLELCSPTYLAEVQEGELLLHLDLVDELGDQTLALRWIPAEVERVFIATRDRAGLLASVCGAISGAGWEILGLSTAERSDGILLDRFAILPSAGLPLEREDLLRSTLTQVLEGTLSPRDLIEARVRREPPPPKAATAPAVRVRVEDDDDLGFTLIDVTAPDRVGLLHDLCAALSECALDILLAKVATKGNRAVDVFHVTGPEGGPIGTHRRANVLRRLARAATPPARRDSERARRIAQRSAGD